MINYLYIHHNSQLHPLEYPWRSRHDRIQGFNLEKTMDCFILKNWENYFLPVQCWTAAKMLHENYLTIQCETNINSDLQPQLSSAAVNESKNTEMQLQYSDDRQPPMQLGRSLNIWKSLPTCWIQFTIFHFKHERKSQPLPTSINNSIIAVQDVHGFMDQRELLYSEHFLPAQHQHQWG